MTTKSVTTKSVAKDPRQQRLAKALRQNLKRRKAQIRGRTERPDTNEEDSGNVSGQKS